MKDTGMPCPIMCGECCSYWRDVEELVDENQKDFWQSCPNETDLGCKLPREERPEACNDHMCEKAEAVLYPNAHTKEMLKEILSRVAKEELEEKARGERRGSGIPCTSPKRKQIHKLSNELSSVHTRVPESVE
jgi:hypothetical protein